MEIVNNKEPNMVKINDIEKEQVLNNNDINNAEIKSNSHFEEDKNEINKEKEKEINTINFDREKFGKKPEPNFAYLHDPSVQSSENVERLKLIEKEKGIRIAQKTLSMSKTGNGFFNNRNMNNEISKYQNNPNLTNFIQYQRLNSNNNRMNYGGKIANNLGGVGHLNIENGMNEIINEPNEMIKMNKTSIGFRPMKKTYEEKLDNFLAANNMKYIEPPKFDKKPPTPIDKIKEKNESSTSNKGNKSLNGSNNNSKKINKK